MKFFRHKIWAAFAMAVFAVFLVFSNPVPRESQAVSTAVLLAAIQTATTFITDQIFASFGDILGGIGEALLGQFLPFTRDAWGRFGTEQLLAFIEGTRYTGDIYQAEVSQRVATTIERERLENLQNSHISAGMCTSVAAITLADAGLEQEEEYNDFLRGASYAQDSFSNETPDGPFTKIPTNLGLTAAIAFMRDIHFDNFCCIGDQKGTVGNLCQAAQDQCGKDRDIAMILGTETVPTEDFGAVYQLFNNLSFAPEEINPIPLDPNRSETQIAYLNQIRERTRDEPAKQFIIDMIAARLEPGGECPKVEGSDFNRLDFVNEIDRNLGRPEKPDRPCPSQVEFHRYVYQDLANDPSFFPGCNTTSPTGCDEVLEALRTRLLAQQIELEQHMNLIAAIDYLNDNRHVQIPLRP